MEVRVDGEKHGDAASDNGKGTVAEAVARISEETARQHRLVTRVKVDGQEYAIPDDPALTQIPASQVAVLELFTEPSRKVAIRVLYEAARHIPRVGEGLVRVSEQIQAREVPDAMRLFTECLTTWEDLNQGIQNAAMTVGVTYAEVEVDGRNGETIAAELVGVLGQAVEVMEQEDYHELADLLEHEAEPKLREVQEVVYKMINLAEQSLH